MLTNFVHVAIYRHMNRYVIGFNFLLSPQKLDKLVKCTASTNRLITGEDTSMQDE